MAVTEDGHSAAASVGNDNSPDTATPSGSQHVRIQDDLDEASSESLRMPESMFGGTRRGRDKLSTSALDASRRSSVDFAAVADVSRHSAFSAVSRRSAASSVLTSSVAHPIDGLRPFAVTCIIVNYISAGYILLPYAFVQSGLVLALFCFVAVSLQSYLTAIYLLETCARAEALHHLIPLENLPIDVTTITDRTNATSSEEDKPKMARLPQNYSLAIRHRKFELSALTRIFLGPTWSRFFSLTTSLDLYGITWTFAAVFGQNLSEHAPILGSPGDDYKLYVCIFLLVSIPLSCISILDQVWVQMSFLVARVVMVCMMVVTLIVAYASPGEAFFESRPDGAALQTGSGYATYSSLIAVLQTCIFATAFQFSIPGVAGISRDRKAIRHSVGAAVLFAFLSNLLVAVLTAYYFGDACEESNNLNWSGFHGRNDSAGANIVASYVVLMAAIDGLAVYPLNAIPLGEGLMAAVHGEKLDSVLASNNWYRIGYRLMASLPQGIGALFVSDLGILAKYAGIFTLVSYTICPAFLHIKSRQEMMERGVTADTYYSSKFLSHPSLAYALIAGSVLLVIGVFFDDAF